MRTASRFITVAAALCLSIPIGVVLHASPAPSAEKGPKGPKDKGKGDHGQGKGHANKGRGHEEKAEHRAFPSKHRGNPESRPAPVGARRFFPAQDVVVIREYYTPQYRTLPPGLQKKLYRTGRLPPGWEKKLQPLPPGVEKRLVVLPNGYRRGYIDGYSVVYDPRTHAVIERTRVFGGR